MDQTIAGQKECYRHWNSVLLVQLDHFHYSVKIKHRTDSGHDHRSQGRSRDPSEELGEEQGRNKYDNGSDNIAELCRRIRFKIQTGT